MLLEAMSVACIHCDFFTVGLYTAVNIITLENNKVLYNQQSKETFESLTGSNLRTFTF